MVRREAVVVAGLATATSGGVLALGLRGAAERDGLVQLAFLVSTLLTPLCAGVCLYLALVAYKLAPPGRAFLAAFLLSLCVAVLIGLRAGA